MGIKYLGEVFEHPLDLLLDVVEPLLVFGGQLALRGKQADKFASDFSYCPPRLIHNPLPGARLGVLVVVLVGLKPYGCLTDEYLKHFGIHYWRLRLDFIEEPGQVLLTHFELLGAFLEFGLVPGDYSPFAQTR